MSLLNNPLYHAFVARYASDPLGFVLGVCGNAVSPDQERLLNAIIDPTAKVSVVSGTGCFGIDTPIMRADGTTALVQNVQVGDTLMGDDNTPRTVLELKRGQEKMYRFTLRNGAEYVFNENHTLCLVATIEKRGFKRGDKLTLSVREYLALPQWWRNRLFFYKSECEQFFRQPENPLPIPPYILGVWLGDGYKNQAEFAINKHDREIIDVLRDYAYSIGCDLTERQESGYVHCRMVCDSVTRNPFTRALKELNLLNNKHIPDVYLYANKQVRHELLAGLLDTDGSLDVHSKSSLFDFISENEQIAQSVAFIANTTGHNAACKQVQKSCEYQGSLKTGTYYRVAITRNIDQIPIKTQRRQTHTPSNRTNHTWFAVEKIEPLGMGDYYGFVLDGNSQFLGADGFVLHNTGKTMSFGRIALWHLLCFPVARYDGKTEIGSNTYIGAPAIKQVGDGVWKEITDAVQQMAANPATAWLAEHIVVQAERVYIKGYKSQWFITKFAMQQGQSVAIAGKHRFYQLIIIDEAAGVSDEHYDVINGTQTQGGNRTLLASQGVKQAGFFYDTHHKLNKANGGNWTALCFSSENSPFVEQEWIDNVALQAGGKDTTEYRVRVLGKFAENEHENLLTRAAIEPCFADYRRADGSLNAPLIEQGEPYGWLLLVDVGAGEYRDDSVCVVAKIIGDDDMGEHARRVEYQPNPIITNTKNIRDFRGLILEQYRELSNARVVLDVGGIGLELAKMLEEDGVEVQRVNWGKPCFKQKYKERFFNQRACAMVRWRDATRQRRVRYPVMDNMLREKFLNQASRIPFHFTDTGTARYQIAAKDEMRRKGIKSPDLADAMSFAFLDDVYYNVSDAAFDVSGSLKNNDDLIAAALQAWE